MAQLFSGQLSLKGHYGNALEGSLSFQGSLSSASHYLVAALNGSLVMFGTLDRRVHYYRTLEGSLSMQGLLQGFELIEVLYYGVPNPWPLP